MDIKEIYTADRLTELAKKLFCEERARTRLDGWFHIKRIRQARAPAYEQLSPARRAAALLADIARELPLELSENAVFAGTQRDAFARSYALINPAFEVETFAGYCDPTEVFDNIEPSGEISREEIERVRAADQDSDYVRALEAVYAPIKHETAEVVYFVEQVTGHTIADFRPALQTGLKGLREQFLRRADKGGDHADYFHAMATALEAPLILAARYEALAREKAVVAHPTRKRELLLLADTLHRVPAEGAQTLYEAIQSFLLLWQVMCLEQSPNPFALSVGNADRLFEPFRAMQSLDRETTAGLLRHLLVFYNVGDRSWAISQNLLVGGKAVDNTDLTSLTSYALLDAYCDMNLPQPILSVKLHRQTPQALYRALGRFFFTPGCLTPSLFNDDALFDVLARAGIAQEDLPDYAVAGCQEPLIMGKDNGNTTNSWLNLAKILELTLTDGVSALTGAQIGCAAPGPASALARLKCVRELFRQNLQHFARRMQDAANNASGAIGLLPVPFLSTFMGAQESGCDMRDTTRQGTKYNASGCLIHGLAVVADSFVAIDCLLRERPEDAQALLQCVKNDFADREDLRQYLAACPKYGNHNEEADREAYRLANEVADCVSSLRNYLGNAFRPDFSTPSTHLLYGYWVGATPDGRRARDMLNYGIDPLSGDAQSGMGMRMLSVAGLPFRKMNGGYASHFGIDPKYFAEPDLAEKGEAFYRRVVSPLFFGAEGEAPFYLYVNVTTPEMLRKVLAEPKKYAPNGVYIMRIHGTFVNFLDLSPAIQEDIIRRLDPASTAL